MSMIFEQVNYLTTFKIMLFISSPWHFDDFQKKHQKNRTRNPLELKRKLLSSSKIEFDLSSIYLNGHHDHNGNCLMQFEHWRKALRELIMHFWTRKSQSKRAILFFIQTFLHFLNFRAQLLYPLLNGKGSISSSIYISMELVVFLLSFVGAFAGTYPGRSPTLSNFGNNLFRSGETTLSLGNQSTYDF